MSDKTTRILPTLAHPLIVNPAQGVGKDKKPPLYLPPFPAIDRNWAGFHLPHLRLVGVNAAERSTPDPLPWQAKLIIDHESRHAFLAQYPFSKVRDHEMLKLYALILTTFEEGQERIPVPLRPYLSRNELEKQWGRVVHIMRQSMLIEEIYAVRSSLLGTRARGLIESEWLLWRLREDYRTGYDEFIYGYAAFYNLFDFVARKIGENAATALVLNALGTINPERTFLEILCYLCNIGIRVPLKDFLKNPSDELLVWNLSPQETSFIRKLPLALANHYFSTRLDESDPDGSYYRRKDMQDDAAMIAKQDSILSQYIKDELIKFVLGQPMTALFCMFSGYSPYIHPFYKVDKAKKGEIDRGVVEDGNFTILIEAIMQQLIQGIGLLCPFWLYPRPHCCSSRNRAFLEKVWKCTADFSCKRWKRMGCLAKDGGPHCNARG
jgi:hypothetical protein